MRGKHCWLAETNKRTGSVDAIIYFFSHLLVGSVVCVAMFDPMGSWPLLRFTVLPPSCESVSNTTSSQACMFRNKDLGS